MLLPAFRFLYSQNVAPQGLCNRPNMAPPAESPNDFSHEGKLMLCVLAVKVVRPSMLTTAGFAEADCL